MRGGASCSASPLKGPVESHRGRDLRRWKVLDVVVEVANPAVLWAIVPFPFMRSAGAA